jgi:hypothetical protein
MSSLESTGLLPRVASAANHLPPVAARSMQRANPRAISRGAVRPQHGFWNSAGHTVYVQKCVVLSPRGICMQQQHAAHYVKFYKCIHLRTRAAKFLPTSM